MPDEFEPGRLLWDQLVLLNDSWRTYSLLYRGSSETDAIIDRSGRWFFQMHRRLLIREILLAISRLTDRATTAGNRNLVLVTILQDPILASAPEFRARLEAEIQNIVNAAEPIRRHRHKYIAHLDHEVAIGHSPPPPPVSWDEIERIIHRMETVYHQYALHSGSDVSFALVALGDVQHMLRKLVDAERWQRYSLHKLRTEGRFPEDPGSAA